MEIKIARNDLLKKLQLAQSVVERKTTMPILANVLLSAENKKLSIAATDLEVGITSSVDAEVLNPGKVTTDARGLHDIIKELPHETVHLKVRENNWLDVSCGRCEFKVLGLGADDFPALPKKGKGNAYQFACESFSQMIEKTSFAMSTDEARYNLNGVLLEQEKSSKNTQLRMVATDGHRLSIIDRDVKGKFELAKPVIIPRKGVIELKRLVENHQGSFELWLDEKHAIASCDEINLFIRLIDGSFPPYKQVVPKESKRIVSVERKAISSALKRVSAMADERSRGVRLKVSPKHLEVSSSNPNLGEAREELSADYRGASFEIGFNARYFIDALNSVKDEQAILELGDDTAPCVLRSEFDSGFTHVIMPMRL